MFDKRVFVSFEGKCEMNCRHCFALEQEDEFNKNDISKIVDSLVDKEFDIIYVSHNKENFTNAEDGVKLCEKLYEKYNKDLCVTSRCILNNEMLSRVVRLNEKMKKNKKRIYWCESVPALTSASIIEDLKKLPLPEERIRFLGRLKINDIYSILTVRPLFPSVVIPDSEIAELISMASDKVDAVITGGLITTEAIDRRLDLKQVEWKYLENNDSAYLVGAISEKARFVDVRKEVVHLKECCNLHGVKFFEHSLQAINYLSNV